MKKAPLVAAVVIGVVLIIALPFLVNGDQFRPEIQSELGSLLGRDITIGHLDLSALRGNLKAADITISDDPAFGKTPFVRAESLEVGVDLIPLIFSHTLHIRSVSLQKPQVVLLHSPSGQWNFSSIGQSANGKESPTSVSTASSGAAAFTVQDITIVDGTLSVGDSPNEQKTYSGVNVTARNVSYSSSFPFSVKANTPGGGTLELDGNAGPANAQDSALTPFQAKANLKQVDLAMTGFVDPSAGISGKLDYQGEIHSDGNVAHTDGTAKLDKLQLVKTGSPATQPISIDYATDYNLANRTGQLTKGQVLTGKSNLAISGTYNVQGASEEVHLKVSAPGIPIQDIQALLPAVGITLPTGSSLQGGEVKTDLSVDGPLDRLVTTGDLNLSNAKLAGFGLSSKIAALAAFAGVKQSPDTAIQVLSSNLRIAPEGMRLDGLDLVVENLGKLTGAGTVDANKALNFKMVANLGAGSSVGIPFLVQGTAANPAFVPDAKGMVNTALQNLVKPTGNNQAGVSNLLNGLVGKKKP